GQGVAAYDDPLFRKLRPHGGYFGRVNPDHGFRQLLDAVAARAEAHPLPYGHWYIDGGEQAEPSPALASLSYKALEPVRMAVVHGGVAKKATRARPSGRGAGSIGDNPGTDAPRRSGPDRRGKPTQGGCAGSLRRQPPYRRVGHADI